MTVKPSVSALEGTVRVRLLEQQRSNLVVPRVARRRPWNVARCPGAPMFWVTPGHYSPVLAYLKNSSIVMTQSFTASADSFCVTSELPHSPILVMASAVRDNPLDLTYWKNSTRECPHSAWSSLPTLRLVVKCEVREVQLRLLAGSLEVGAGSTEATTLRAPRPR